MTRGKRGNHTDDGSDQVPLPVIYQRSTMYEPRRLRSSRYGSAMGRLKPAPTSECGCLPQLKLRPTYVLPPMVATTEIVPVTRSHGPAEAGPHDRLWLTTARSARRAFRRN